MGRRKIKTHEQDLARVRENQRRHRAKIKDHIAILEQKLAEKDILLAQAEDRIAQLTTALEFERRRVDEKETQWIPDEPLLVTLDTSSPESAPQSEVSQPSQPPSTSLSGEFDLAGKRPCEGLCPWVYLSTVGIASPQRLPTPETSGTVDDTNKAITLTGSFSYAETVDLVSKQCLDLDPPRFGESTTLCITAYNLIDQQNYRGLETNTIYQWLRQGFRSGYDRLDGCRVENGILFSLLDFVSST